jgi:uncharacterized protein YlzI (FlbEa/FlbD family)
MDSELRRKLEVALETARGKGVHLTPYATTLLTVVVESIGDTTAQRIDVKETVAREAQDKVIKKIPNYLQDVSKAYQQSELIDGLMLLTVMPRLMRDYCPPFQAK